MGFDPDIEIVMEKRKAYLETRRVFLETKKEMKRKLEFRDREWTLKCCQTCRLKTYGGYACPLGLSNPHKVCNLWIKEES